MGSPFYAGMLRRLADDYDNGGVTRTFFDADRERENRSRPGIRLMGAFHFCALDGSAPNLARHFPSAGGDGDATAGWHACRNILIAKPEKIERLFERIPQTNEVGRATLLLAASLATAAHFSLPLRIFEIGASAGLNSRFDRFRYEGANWSWGDSSPLVLQIREATGKPNFLETPLFIAERHACDLNPLDPGSKTDCLELLSFIWADQRERISRLRSALAVARQFPITVEKAEMYAWICNRVTLTTGFATVVMHSVVFEHLSLTAIASLRELFRTIGNTARSSAPFAWLRMEYHNGGFETRITLWPDEREILIARSDGHGNSIHWNESAPPTA